MADGLNKVMLLGNLGADPELKFTQGGQAILKMRLAASESYLDRNKQRQERTEWVSVVLWGKRAEALSKFLSKGSKLYVEGGLRTSSYEDREGFKRYKTEVVASNIILCGSSRGGGRKEDSDDGGPPDDYDDGPAYGGGGSSGGSSTGGDTFNPPAGSPDDDDIPF